MVITISSQKGGTGKTTTATALASMMHEMGYKTLLIDADQQCNSTDTYRAEIDGQATLYDVLLEDEATAISEAIQQTEAGYIVAGDPLLREADQKLKDDPAGKFRLQDALENLEGFDYVFIDTSPNMGEVLYNCLAASDCVIVPVTADRYSLQGLQQLNKTISGIKRINPKLQIDGLLLTKFNSRTLLAKDAQKALEGIAVSMNTKLYETTIRNSTKAQEAQALRTTLNKYAPSCTTAIDYKNFIAEFIKEK